MAATNIAGGDANVLAQRAQQGDRAAFAQLVQRLAPSLLRFLRTMGLSEHDAEDIVQETFLRVHQKLDRFDGQHCFSTWLFTIGRRRAISHLRGRKPRLGLGDAEGNFAPTTGASATLAVDHADEATHLWQMAARVLPEAQHQALWLRYGQGLEMTELAAVLDVTPANARVILHRARHRLAEALRPTEPAACAPEVLP